MHLTIDPRTVTAPARTGRSDQKGKPEEAEVIRQRCQDFGAIYIQSLFKAMRQTIPDGGLFSRDTAHEIYEDLLDGEIATQIARKQGLGLADEMYKQIMRLRHPQPER